MHQVFTFKQVNLKLCEFHLHKLLSKIKILKNNSSLATLPTFQVLNSHA